MQSGPRGGFPAGRSSLTRVCVAYVAVRISRSGPKGTRRNNTPLRADAMRRTPE